MVACGDEGDDMRVKTDVVLCNACKLIIMPSVGRRAAEWPGVMRCGGGCMRRRGGAWGVGLRTSDTG